MLKQSLPRRRSIGARKRSEEWRPVATVYKRLLRRPGRPRRPSTSSALKAIDQLSRPMYDDDIQLSYCTMGGTRARQRALYDGLWRAGRSDALSPDLMRFRVWRPHLKPLVVDIGAGDALLSRTNPSMGVISVDLSSTGLTHAGGRAAAGAAEALPFRDGCMQTVVLSEVLEHAEQPTTVLAECRRVLHADGKLLLSTPLWPLAHAENLYHWLRIRQRPRIDNIALWDPNHERRYRLDDLVAEVRSAGFSVDETTLLFGSGSTAALYFVEPLVARISGWRLKVAHRMTVADRLLRPFDHASGAALVCSPCP